MLDPKWSAMTVAASFSGTASSRLAFLKPFRKAAEQGAKQRYPKEAAAVIAAPGGTASVLRAFLKPLRKPGASIAAHGRAPSSKNSKGGATTAAAFVHCFRKARSEDAGPQGQLL